MSQEADKKMEGLDLCMGIARLRVDARATIKVKGVEVTKIYPGDIDPDNRIGRSNLAAWLAASKAALAASQADHQETQRRISKLQEGTRSLSIVDFPEHNGTEATHISERGRDVGKDGGVAAAEGPAKAEKPCGEFHLLHCMTLGVIAQVVSFLEPPSVLSYARACKAAEDALRQDECWGGIFRVRHLKLVGGAALRPPAFSSSGRQSLSESSHADGTFCDVAALEDSDAPVPNRGLSVLAGAPHRRAVIAHARSLSQALRLFDVAVSDGGTTKAVVNGPVRTAAAVASLRALVEITANVCDPLARRAFADVRTGQMLLSIITSEHGSAVLQDLACAVLGNLFCDPEAAADRGGRAANFDLLDDGAAHKLLGRSKRSAIHALTALCSSTRPSLSSWSTTKNVGGGGMRPAENLPGRQASRALINLLLPRYQVSQQSVTMPNDTSNVGDRTRIPAARSFSLPFMPSPARREPSQLQGKALDRSSQAFAPARSGEKESSVEGAQSMSAAWEEGAAAEDGSLPGVRGGGRGGGEGEWRYEKNQERSAEGRTALPRAAAPAAGGELVQLLSVEPTKQSSAPTTSATPLSGDSAPSSSQGVPKAACPLPGQPVTPARQPLASRPPQTSGEAPVPVAAVSSPTRPPTTETHGHLPTRAALSAEAGVDRKPHPMSPQRHKSPRPGSLKPVATPTAQLRERAKHCSGCDLHNEQRSDLVDLVSTPLVDEPGVCSIGGGQQVEETWEAFYFYHTGGVKDTFLVTLRFPATSERGVSGRGTDKLGNFVMEGGPLLGNTAGDTWFISKTYTGRGLPDAAGGGWSGSAHVTHTAYLTDGLAHDYRALEPTLRPPLRIANKSGAGRHTGLWGVWEPVLGRAGSGDSGSSTTGASFAPDGCRKTLSRRGGVFRLVPKQQEGHRAC